MLSSRNRGLLAGLIALLLLTACGGGRPAPTPTPTKTPRPEATPTPTPDPNRCPLTGEHLDDPSLTQRRPLIVKIGNDTRSRPQSGLHKADLVIEHLTEGGITRLDAIYLCQDFEAIGPVRSARLIDIWLASMFDGILAHVGSSGGVHYILVDETNFPRVDDRPERGDPPTLVCATCFYLDPPDPALRPYNTFTRASALWKNAEERGWQHPMQVPPLLFGELDSQTPREEKEAVAIRYFFNNIVRWQWDPQAQKYFRFTNDEPHIEATTREQVTAANVVIIWVEHKQTNIIEDENKQLSLDIKPWGEGKAVLLRDGYLVTSRWTWGGPGTPLTLYDESGVPLPLAVGNSWIQVVPLNLELQIE